MRNFLAIAIVSGFLFGGLSDASGRQWKPDKTKQAIDYLQIQYHMPGNEFVILQWLAPAMFEDTAENKVAREMMSTYVMIFVAHARITPLGQWEHIDPSDVSVETGDGAIWQPLSYDSLPPAVTGFLAAFSQVMAQGLGQLGHNAVMMVFDKHGIEECQTGAFWVRYVGEKFDFETPIPGCS